MKIQIKARLFAGEFAIATIAVEGDDLARALLAFAQVAAPHLEAEKTLQISSMKGWCDEHGDYCHDVPHILGSFQRFKAKQAARVDAVGRQMMEDISQHFDVLAAQRRQEQAKTTGEDSN